MDEVKSFIEAWNWFWKLPQGQRNIFISALMGAIAMGGLGWMFKLFASDASREHMENVIRENAQALREDVGKVNENLTNFKIETSGHFGRIDSRMEAFQSSLDAHDKRGIDLRKDVKDAINSRTKMV